jgi:hypothetical protein
MMCEAGTNQVGGFVRQATWLGEARMASPLMFHCCKLIGRIADNPPCFFALKWVSNFP